MFQSVWNMSQMGFRWDMPRSDCDLSVVFFNGNVIIHMGHVPMGCSMGHASIWLGHVLCILHMECSNRYGTCPKWVFDGTCLDMVGTCPTNFFNVNVTIHMGHVPMGCLMGHASIWLGHVRGILHMECSNRYGTCPKWVFDGTCLDMVGTCPMYFSMKMLQSIWDMYQWDVR
jgi:hypothetical protein